MLESIAAGAIVLACVALLVRQFIGASRRAYLDATVERIRPFDAARAAVAAAPGAAVDALAGCTPRGPA
jgi:hypothetical protein